MVWTLQAKNFTSRTYPSILPAKPERTASWIKNVAIKGSWNAKEHNIFQGKWKNVTAVQTTQAIRHTFATIHWLIQVRVLSWPKFSG